MIRIRVAISTAVILLLSFLWTSASTRCDEPPPKKELTAEQKEKLKERDKQKNEAKELRAAGKLTEAVAAAEKMLAIEREVFGDVHEEVAGSYEFIGDVQLQREDIPAVRKAYGMTLEICRKLYGVDSWKVTDARLALAHADKLSTLSSQERRKVAEASSIMTKASILYGQGKYLEAVELARQSLDMRKNVLGDNDLATAMSLNNLGVLLKAQGDYAGARPYYEQTLAIRKNVLGDNHPDTAISLNNLGALLKAQGDYAGARPYYEQALAIRKKVLGDNHPDTANSLNNLGLLLKEQGDYARARLYLEQALAINKKVLGDNHPDTALSLNNLGMLLIAQRDYAGARPYYEQALTIRKKVLGDNHPDTATSLNNLGTLLVSQGDYAGARPYHEQALTINKRVLGDNHPHTATSLNNLGTLLVSQGDYAGARPYLEQALAITKKVLGDNHRDTATSLNNLGGVLYEQGDYAGARAYYEQALAICKKILGDNHLDTAGSLNNLGTLLVRQGDYAGARPYLEQALAIHKKLLDDNHPATATSLSNVGILLYEEGDYAGARTYLEQAMAISRNSLELAASAFSERQQLDMNRNARLYLDSYLTTLSEGDVPAGTAYVNVLAWKGAVQARQRQLRAGRKDPALAPLVVELQQVSQELANLAFQVPDPKQLADHRQKLAWRTQKKEELERTLAQRSAAFKQGQALVRLTPQQVQILLPPRTVLVDLLEYGHFSPDTKIKGKLNEERRLVAFVTGPSGSVVRVDLGSVKPIAEAVDAWRKGFGQRAAGKVGAAEATLRQLVWAPLEPHLKDATTVLISPDGDLTRFPFGALPGKEPGKYLIEELAIAVVPVPKLLPELLVNAEAPAEPSLLLVGDVDYGADPGKGVNIASAPTAAGKDRAALLGKSPSLAGTRAEILAIKDSFQERFPGAPVTDLRKAKATENEVRKQAPGHRCLHFATHGFFAPKELKSALAIASSGQKPGDLFAHQSVTGWNPGLLSGIVLAGANQPLDPSRDDGILTALEVAELDLNKVELAVLSACETGLGETAGGEGILGLQRAFQVAGAKSVVASLWKVDDKCTRDLMVRFYENLWQKKPKKMSKLEALREAQLWMLKEGGSRGLEFSKDQQPDREGRLPPYYWAGFVLSGDWR